MKWIVATGLVVFLLTGCSDFYHLHYRKLNKIPAKGEWTAATHRENSTASFSISRTDSAHVALRNSDDSAISKAKTVATPSQPAVALRVKKWQSERKISAAPRRMIRTSPLPEKTHDGSFFLVLFLLFIGFFLIVSGLALCAAGIFLASAWVFLAGLAAFLLGLLPFAGVVTKVVGTKANPPRSGYREPEKKMKRS